MKRLYATLFLTAGFTLAPCQRAAAQGATPNRPDPTEVERLKKKLQTLIAEAAEKNKTDCANSVAAAAEALGVTGLKGKRANDQIDFMKANWDTLTPKEAQDAANMGRLAVAGRKDTPHGHVAIVVPGASDKRFGHGHPNLAGGSLDPDHPSEPGRAYSTDGKTIGKIWNLNEVELTEISYYSPKLDRSTYDENAPKPDRITYDENAPRSPSTPVPAPVSVPTPVYQTPRSGGTAPGVIYTPAPTPYVPVYPSGPGYSPRVGPTPVPTPTPVFSPTANSPAVVAPPAAGQGAPTVRLVYDESAPRSVAAPKGVVMRVGIDRGTVARVESPAGLAAAIRGDK